MWGTRSFCAISWFAFFLPFCLSAPALYLSLWGGMEQPNSTPTLPHTLSMPSRFPSPRADMRDESDQGNISNVAVVGVAWNVFESMSMRQYGDSVGTGIVLDLALQGRNTTHATFVGPPDIYTLAASD